jgi:hypothetical protein
VPVALYWVILSFVSITNLDAFRLRVAGYPITALDIAVLAILVGCVLRIVSANWVPLQPTTAIALGIAGLIVYGVLLAALGLVHHYHLYSVLIDLRTLLYLGIGYWGGRVLLDLRKERRVLIGLIWTAAVGFVVAEAAATVGELRAVATTGVQLIDRRDLGVPFFTGKFGLLISAVRLHVDGLHRAWWAALLFVLSVWAVTLTFTRSTWLGAAVGILVVALYYGIRFLLTVAGLTVGTLLLLLGLAIVLPYGREFIAAAQSKHITAIGSGSGSLLATPRVSGGQSVPSTSPSQAQPSPAPTSGSTDTISFRLKESWLALSQLHSPMDWLFGTGLGLSVDDQIHPYQHDSFIWFLSKGGLMGLAIFLWVVVIQPTARGVGRLWIDHAYDPLLLVIIAGYIAGIVGGLTSGNLSYWSYSAALGLTIAWIEQLTSQEAGSGSQDLSVGGRRVAPPLPSRETRPA